MHVSKLWLSHEHQATGTEEVRACATSHWPELDLRAESEQGAWTITCRGDLVSDTAPALRRAVGHCIATRAETIRLELGGVEDVDVIGLRAAIDAGEACAEQGIELTIALSGRAYHLYCLANPSARGHATLRRRLQSHGAATAAAAQPVTVIAV